MVVGRKRIQAGIPMRPYRGGYERASGLLFRGVVVATYELDNSNHPEAVATEGVDAVAIYCDVLIYSSMWNQRFQFLKSVLVSQDIGGMHRGRVWKPRAAKLDVTEPNQQALDLDRKANPANLDGDHVLVGFIDDNLNQPVILRGIPHPSADTGNEVKEPGKRMRLKVADGDPDFWKHHGGFYGISDAGDFVVDLTEAYSGEGLKADGTERPAAEDGTTGNYLVKLPKSGKVTVQIEGGASFDLDLKDSDAKMTLGDGAVSMAVAERIQTLYNTLKTKLDAADIHVHPDAFGGTGVTTVPVVAPVFDTKIVSDKAKMPDTT